jgi:hypothetical protein
MERYSAGLERQDYHAGLICSVLANINRDPKGKPYTPADFMPGHQETKTQKQTPTDMLKVVKMWQSALEAKEKKNGGRNKKLMDRGRR